MPLIYRLLTEDDTSEFCHKVSLALSKGWVLYGNPTYVYDHANGVMRVGQAVTKDVEAAYSRDMKLGQQ
ncbi:hypothetical protein OA238_c04270 [Octadecabacter arcticus 238]|uniref:DUF1737 domain-containing protein n=1 Tax=Octadecabacter arcticus 238 TaxID=391616 RepID=M9RFZ3_9RHOB|nr:DUF1737 domain-containing protein [Octadecabacter arcticus]AGI70673.1 hypothetical protein OA238_c04270 [Octadecabacter arcticus 238]